jgi:hypothetical protein
LHASGIVKRLVKSRIEFFTRRERDRSGDFREIQAKAAKRPKKGLERHGAAVQHTVAFLQFLLIEALAAMLLAPSPRASPHIAEPPQKPEKRESSLSTRRACRLCNALNAGQKFECRSTFSAVRALVVPPERGQGTETGKLLVEPWPISVRFPVRQAGHGIHRSSSEVCRLRRRVRFYGWRAAVFLR